MEENREQPLEEPANVSGETIDESAASENGSLLASEQGQTEKSSIENQDNSQEPENYGKFKSAKALLEAYNNLQAEFTKKCQRLSALEQDKKEIETNEIENDFEKNFSSFLEKNAEAKNYVEELKNKVSGQTSLVAIENAWSSVILDHIKQNVAEDNLKNKYVLNDENVRKQIIQSYISNLNKQNIPTVITSDKGVRVSDESALTPQSLSDAKKLLERMFN